MYWLGGAASILIGNLVSTGLDFGAAADAFSLAVTMIVSYLLISFGGLLWMVSAARMMAEEK